MTTKDLLLRQTADFYCSNNARVAISMKGGEILEGIVIDVESEELRFNDHKQGSMRIDFKKIDSINHIGSS